MKLDPNKIQLCRVGQHSADAKSMGQPCGCPVDTCALWCGGLKPANARKTVSVLEAAKAVMDRHEREIAGRMCSEWIEVAQLRKAIAAHEAHAKGTTT
jgi:hypothetical protein